jgi:two-component system NtrC family sensor kinase
MAVGESAARHRVDPEHCRQRTHKADLIKEYQPLPDIECLPSQINQVIMNLVVNAAQAMGPERGTITLRTGQQQDTAWVEVADTGAGIAPDILQKIFDPFFTTKPVGQGTGLGLSLSYGMSKHGGDISVRSSGVGRPSASSCRCSEPARGLRPQVAS